jgi:EmrB/QacA subfamily drug resistance transporter
MDMEQAKWHNRRWIALAFLACSLLIISLDTTVVNLALPSISKNLGSSASGLQWIVDAYTLVFAASLLTLGSIGDRIGRKITLQVGLIAFGLFSLGGALSNSTGMLIAMRGAMGLAGAALMPSTLSILTATFRDPKERAQAIAMWAAVFALGAGIGPLVGGWLLQRFQWEAVFYINMPVVAIALIGGYFFIHNSKDEHPRKVDLVGSLLSIAGLFALVYGIIEAGQSSWTAHKVLYSFGAAVVLLAAFTVSEWRSSEPMLPLRFFRNMSFTGANMALALISFAMFGIMFFMSQYFQTVQGYNALQAGVRLLPMAGMSFVAAIMSAKVAQRVGTKVAVGTGILIASAGLFYLSQIAEADTSYSMIVLVMCIISMGMGLTMSPATNSIMGSLPVNKAGVGSAMNDTTRLLGGALGVAVLGTIMNNIYIAKINDTLSGALSSSPQLLEAARSSIQGAHIAAQQIQSINPTLAGMIVDSANQAFMSGMVRAVMIAGIIMVVASLVTFIILPMRVRPAKEEDQTTSASEMARETTPISRQ